MYLLIEEKKVSLVNSIRMGKKLLKKYAIIKKIREVPGYFQVFRAHQTGLDRDVELRLLNRPSTGKESDQFDRFRRQFKALSRLDHPSVVKVLDVGYTKTRMYYTTEYRNSISLDELLGRIGGPMTRHEVLEVAESVGSALEHIHSKNLLHRNISLDTVFYDLDNKRTYVSEFALVKDIEQASLPAGSTLTKFNFIPTPEFYDNAPFTQSTDLFMLGALLYQLATFRSPFPPPNTMEGLSPDDIFNIPKPSSINGDVSKKLEAIIMRLLSRNPSEKFYSAEAFLQTLDRKKRLMDFDSLINHERHDIIQGFRKKMKLPDEEGLEVEEETEEESSGSAEEGTAFIELLEELSNKVTGNRDNLLGVIVFLGLISFAGVVWVGWPLIFPEKPTMSDRSYRNQQLVARLKQPPSAFEEDVVKVVANMQLNPLTEDVFPKNWTLLKSYLMSLPEETRNKVYPYNRLLSIKLRFHRDKELACKALQEAFLACDQFIKSPTGKEVSNKK